MAGNRKNKQHSKPRSNLPREHLKTSMRRLGELIGKGKDRVVEDRADKARRIWERIGTMAGNGKSTRFSVEKKIDSQQLPPDLKDWDYLKGLPDSFEVLIESNIGRLITLIIETRYKRLSMRGSNDVAPIYQEGIVEGVSFEIEPQKDPLDFADKFTRFVFHQRQHT